MIANPTPINLKELNALFDSYANNLKEGLFQFLRFPSISTDPNHKKDLQACCSWLQRFIEDELQCKTEIWQTSDHPTLFAEKIINPSLPTVLLYGHYDVQPVDPIDKWISEPFAPEERNGHIYARGACDDKGQIFYALAAVKALVTHYNGSLPCNIKLCIEGGEEIGSSGFSEILQAKQAKLQSDFALIVDGGIPDADTPAICLGARGIVTGELTITGPSHDLHSGTHGGVVYNPLHAISEIIANLRDNKGMVAIEGFYDEVVELPQEELDALSWDFFDKAQYEKAIGTEATGGETELPPGIRGALRPTLEVNGLWGGYINPGFKTVIPSTARAKISCRLVPKQTPEHVIACLKNHFSSLKMPGITVDFACHEGAGKGIFTSPKSKVATASREVYQEVFGKECVNIAMGGSVPITDMLARHSQAETLIVGLALERDLIHAPNESFEWERFRKGYLIIARIIEKLSSRNLN